MPQSYSYNAQTGKIGILTTNPPTYTRDQSTSLISGLTAEKKSELIKQAKTDIFSDITKYIDDCKQNNKFPSNTDITTATNTFKDNAIKKITNTNMLLQTDIDSIKSELNTYVMTSAATIRANLANYHKSTGITQEKTNDKTVKNLTYKDPNVSPWLYTNISYSGCDMVVHAQMVINDITHNFKTIGYGNADRLDQNVTDITLGSLQTISYSIYDRMVPIRSLGNVNAKDFVHSHRVIAGSMVFVVFNQHWAKDFIKAYKKQYNLPSSAKVLMDEMPPLNITVSMANEYGAKSRLAIYGVRFYNEGKVMSINDIYTEHTFQFMATNVDNLEDIQDIGEIQEPYNILLPKEPDPVFTPIDKTKKDKSDNKYTIPVDKDIIAIPDAKNEREKQKQKEDLEKIRPELDKIKTDYNCANYLEVRQVLTNQVYDYSQNAVKGGTTYSEESLERLENNYNNLRTAAILAYKEETGQISYKPKEV